MEESAEAVGGAEEADRFGFGFDAVVVDVEEAGVLVEKGFGFELEAHPFAALFEVAERDDLAWFVEDFFDDAGALLVSLVQLYGSVEFWVLAPHYFQA